MVQAQIDHVVLLLRYKDLVHPPSWITDNFTITPGGTHSDNRTANKLVIFQDGTYLELIAFIDDNPALRKEHPWGNKGYGFIDFSLTTKGEFDYPSFAGRIKENGRRLGIQYEPPKEGGRKRAVDDKSVKWKVTFPENQPGASNGRRNPFPACRRGELPFFTQDVTPRDLRVDTSKTNTTHPSGALGIAQITVLVPRSSVDSYVDLYSSVLDTEPIRVFGTTRLPMDTPVQVPDLVKPWVFVEEPSLEAERKRLAERGPGIHEIALRIGTEGRIGVARAPIGGDGFLIHFLK